MRFRLAAILAAGTAIALSSPGAAWHVMPPVAAPILGSHGSATAAGAGIEVTVAQHLSSKFEYLHYDAGSVSGVYRTTGILPTNVAYTSTYRGNLLRLGVNYRF